MIVGGIALLVLGPWQKRQFARAEALLIESAAHARSRGSRLIDATARDGVAFAATGPAIATALATQGITLSQSARQGALPPEDLARQTARMTVLVSCWD